MKTPAMMVMVAGLAVSGVAVAQVKPEPVVTTARPASPKGGPAAPAVAPNGKGGEQPRTGTGARPTGLTPATPAAKGAEGGATEGQPEPEMFNIPAFTEPVQLSSLVELVGLTLKINIVMQGEVPGTVVFNAPLPVKRTDLIPLLDRLLEQQQYTITQDEFGFYTVHPINAVNSNPNGDQATTRIIHTPNLRPSSLKAAIEGQVGQPTQGQGVARAYAYVDDIGVIIVTDTPRRVAAIGRLVDKILAESAKATYTRLELHHIAAAQARARALELVGSTAPRAGINEQAAAAGATARVGALDNLGDRLTVDSQGNALLFRGLVEEADTVRKVLAVLDVPNNLKPQMYEVGSQGSMIADLANKKGLGEVTTISSPDQMNGTGLNMPNLRGNNNQQQQSLSGGPLIVVDEGRGSLIYYATDQQHEQMKALIAQIDPQSEKVVIGVYKLRNADAESVAQIVMGLIQNQTPTASNDLLPNGGRSTSTRRPTNTGMNAVNANLANRNRTPGATGAAGELSLDSTGFVVADIDNSQVLVKAPQGQQADFARLISKLDLRRAQVYIEAKIVTVTWSDDMRLAFETQLVGSSGGVLNTNFGLGSFGTAGAINAAKTVATGLPGLTAAIIKSDQVPIIINALQTKSDGRILSSPQLLVDDNEEASIVSVDSQPTSTTTQNSGNDQITGFAGYEDAGTKLTVTPHISDGGYLGLKYEIELSSFTGTSTASLPPPKVTNTLKSESITIPTNTTVVIGGLNLDSKNLTKVQVPFLGDIPIVGLLFQDRHNVDKKTTLYVFLTPRILREPNFSDMTLLTEGPQSTAGLSPDIPKLNTAMIDVAMYVLPPRMPTATDQHAAPVSPTPIVTPDQPPTMAPERPGEVVPHEPVHEDKSRGDDPVTSPVTPVTPVTPATPKDTV